VIEATYGYAQTVERGFRIAIGEGFTGRIAATGRPNVIASVAGVPALEPFLREADIGSLLGVPLRRDGRTIGVLHVGTVRSRQFTNEDTSLLQLAGDRAALAIEHSRSYERERGVVETLQRSLITRAPATAAGLQMAARYQPAACGPTSVATGTTRSPSKAGRSGWRWWTWSGTGSRRRR